MASPFDQRGQTVGMQINARGEVVQATPPRAVDAVGHPGDIISHMVRACCLGCSRPVQFRVGVFTAECLVCGTENALSVSVHRNL